MHSAQSAACASLVFLAWLALSGGSFVNAQTGAEPTRSPQRALPRHPDGMPDLSGVWVNRTATPLERPEALKDKLTLSDAEVAEFRARAARIFQNPNSDTPVGDTLFLAVLADIPEYKNPNTTEQVDFNPLTHQREFDHRTSLIVDPPDGRIPALTPQGRRRQSAEAARGFAVPWQPGADALTAERQLVTATAALPQPTSAAELTAALRCITWGLPRVGGNAFYTSHFQIVQAQDHIVTLQEVNHEARVIPLDGRGPLPAAIRQWNGDSRGRWEGDTLVVETRNFSPASHFRGSAENLHLLERFTHIDADTIEYRVTIEDPTTWTRPWTAMVPLKRSTDRLYEFACHEGNYYTIRGILGADQRRGGPLD